MKQLLFSLVILTGVFAACKKSETVTPAAPKPLEKSVVTEALLINAATQISATGSGNYEYGIKFGVTQNGKINRLGCRMPTAGTYRVTLWDGSVTPKVVLSTANVTIPAGGSSFSSITPVSITTGKDYFLTIWSSGQWFYITPSGGGNFSYPITQGSVQIKGYQWVGSAQSPQTFPTNIDNSYIAGIMDFDFQPD